MENDQKMEGLLITPQVRIMQVIEAYPELEETLIAYVPAFKKLKNPLLRNTVAKVTTLQQVASIGNVELGDLINLLRQEVGQELIEDLSNSKYVFTKPEWFDENLVWQELDSREMLSRGEHPVNQAMADLSAMAGGRIYKLIAPFLPAPLIDKAASIDIDHWVVKKETDLYLIYFFKR